MARWLSFFAEYNSEMKYTLGKQNVLADALSRRTDYDPTHVTTRASSIKKLIRVATGFSMCGIISCPWVVRSTKIGHGWVSVYIDIPSIMVSCAIAQM